MTKIKKTFYTSFLILIFCSVVSCKDQKINQLYKNADIYKEDKNFEKAFTTYVKVFKRKPNTEVAIKAAINAGDIAYIEIKKNHQALTLFNYVIVHSKNKEEVFNSQIKIARIYFENLRNFDKAIESYFNLIKNYPEKEERKKWRMKVVRAYFTVNNFYQAASELKELFKEKLNKNEYYDFKKIEANIYMAIKQPNKALDVYKNLIDRYKNYKENKSLYINMAICYEDLAEYKSAIDILTTAKKYYPEPEFIDIMLKRLSKRIENQPGAKGRIR